MSVRARIGLLIAFLLSGVGVLTAVVLAATADPVEKGPKDSPRPALYDADPAHLWNRLHAAVLVRTGPDGHDYGQDRLEPLLWNESEYLLKGPSADRAAAVLDEFVRGKGETLVADPVRRAVLQRDLWLAFNWLAVRPDGHDELSSPAGKRLGTLLAGVVRRLALTPEQVAALPDNYAAAVASKEFADRFDPEKPERPYLPPDLFQADGPWVCVGRSDAPPASHHVDETGTNRFTNSVFLTFIKLPDGRQPTLDWLKRMAAFDQPLLLADPADKGPARRPTVPNPAVPQLPAGTEVALVRRALLVDARRRVVASPLTESVQVRVMRADGGVAATPDDLSVVGNSGDSARRGFERQAFFEFQLRRADLFAGRAGGLRDVSDQRDFKTGFASHQWDPFDAGTTSDRPFPDRALSAGTARTFCLGCHYPPGVQGLQSLQRMGRAGEAAADRRRPSYPLGPTSVAEVEQAMVKWKQDRPGWKALAKLLPD